MLRMILFALVDTPMETAAAIADAVSDTQCHRSHAPAHAALMRSWTSRSPAMLSAVHVATRPPAAMAADRQAA